MKLDSPDAVCRRCHHPFVIRNGAAGQFCCRPCYERKEDHSPACTADLQIFDYRGLSLEEQAALKKAILSQ